METGSIVPELATELKAGNAEGPLWHPEQRLLYITDIPRGRLFAYDPATGKHEVVYQGRTVGGMTLQADGHLLLFRDNGNVVSWNHGEEVEVIGAIKGEEGMRFNDAEADPKGRVFSGTYADDGHAKGRLYRIEPDGAYEAVVDGLGCSNGMGFTPDLTGFYLVDSPTHTVFQFDYDVARGKLSERRALITTPPERGFPDGMTVDAEGFVWVAYWDGRAVSRFTPEGQEDMRIGLPVKKVSCVTIVDDVFYVSSAGHDNVAENGRLAGSLFKFRVPGVKGVPEFRSRIKL